MVVVDYPHTAALAATPCLHRNFLAPPVSGMTCQRPDAWPGERLVRFAPLRSARWPLPLGIRVFRPPSWERKARPKDDALSSRPGSTRVRIVQGLFVQILVRHLLVPPSGRYSLASASRSRPHTFGSSSISRACRPVVSQAISVEPDPPKGSKTRAAALTAVSDCFLHQFHRLHRGVKIVDRRFVHRPHVSLVAVAAPVMRGSLRPTVENGFVLPLIVRSS